jgi:hypothetical protein
MKPALRPLLICWLVLTLVGADLGLAARSFAAGRPKAKPTASHTAAKTKSKAATKGKTKAQAAKGKSVGKTRALAAKKGGAQTVKAKAPSAAELKKRKALAKECATKSKKKTAKCKVFLAEAKERAQDAENARLAKKCAKGPSRKTKQCKAFRAAQAKSQSSGSICGRKYGTARKKESLTAFARRYRVSAGTVRAMNGLDAKIRRLKGGKRYLVYKSPQEGVVLTGGVLLEADIERFGMQRPHRGWGKPLLVDVLRNAIATVHASTPQGSRLIVGDLSKEGGGCLPPHRSHRGGLDVDLGLYMRGGHQRSWLGLATPETLDADRTWQLLRAFLATNSLQYVFLDIGLQKPLYEAALRAGETPKSLEPVLQYPRPIERARESIVRHLKGHADHIHARFYCLDEVDCALPEVALQHLRAARLETLGGPANEDSPRRRVPGVYRRGDGGYGGLAVMP